MHFSFFLFFFLFFCRLTTFFLYIYTLWDKLLNEFGTWLTMCNGETVRVWNVVNLCIFPSFGYNLPCQQRRFVVCTLTAFMLSVQFCVCVCI
uniref:Uncharacterized protein n=1 Tax=Ixodes ricinus TaxID=34613 RepID=A0A147BF45_IXORI